MKQATALAPGWRHERKASAIDSIESVKRNAAGTEIDDQTDK